MTTDMKITVEYFAILREERGLTKEEVETSAQSASELYTELASQHSFSLPPTSVRVSINEELVPWESSLSHGDLVVFIPPVAGG